jgi:ATP-dependent Zn protease
MRKAAIERTAVPTSEQPDAVLRRLARLAVGRSGADVERLVREARRLARREGRPLTLGHLEEAFGGEQLARPPDVRRRMAVHEAGHVIVHQALDEGDITLISIEAAHGGVVRTEAPAHRLQTMAAFESAIAVKLAGRAAELLVFGDFIAGSGGSAESDLAVATMIAMEMETGLGFGRHQPLLYRPMADRSHMLALDRQLAADVHARLAAADEKATTILTLHCDAHAWLAEEIERHGVLEGEALADVIGQLRTKIVGRTGGPVRAEVAQQAHGVRSAAAGGVGTPRLDVPPQRDDPPAP